MPGSISNNSCERNDIEYKYEVNIFSVPCGFNDEGLPVGFPLISKSYGDGVMLNIAEVYEKAENWMSYLEKNEVYLVGEAMVEEA